MKTNKIWSSIKKNKVKIGIISAGLAGIITTGALCGTLGISKTAEQLDSVKTHVYDGTIKFLSNLLLSFVFASSSSNR